MQVDDFDDSLKCKQYEKQILEQSDQGTYCKIPLKERLPLDCVFWLLVGIQSMQAQKL